MEKSLQFQEKIFQALLTDHRWGAQMIEVMAPTFFELRYLSYLTEKYFMYFTKYRSFPTPQLLVSIVRDNLADDDDLILKEQVGVKVTPKPRAKMNVKVTVKLTVQPCSIHSDYRHSRQRRFY